jgi:hypothetical protein
MAVVTMYGTAPDGSPLTVHVHVVQDDELTCPAQHGTGVQAFCTLDRGHPGPWHVATTTLSIVTVWPVEPGYVPAEAMLTDEPERHPDAYGYGEPWGPDNPAPGSAWDTR